MSGPPPSDDSPFIENLRVWLVKGHPEWSKEQVDTALNYLVNEAKQIGKYLDDRSKE
jgi:hypothetical protein